MLNKVLLIGNLVKDPESGTTANGKVYSRFTVAINNGFGQTQTTDYIPCTAWSSSASFLNTYLKKGDKVYVEGRLSISSTFDNLLGKNIQRINVNAINVQSLSSRRNQSVEDQSFYKTSSMNQIIDSNVDSYNTDSAFSPKNINSSYSDQPEDDLGDEWMNDLEVEEK